MRFDLHQGWLQHKAAYFHYLNEFCCAGRLKSLKACRISENLFPHSYFYLERKT